MKLAQALGLSGRQRATELYVRSAHRDGRLLITLRALDCGDSCVVEATRGTQDGTEPAPPDVYAFVDAHEATVFVTEAVEALMYLGCEVTAD
jgi:hypothetical protein